MYHVLPLFGLLALGCALGPVSTTSDASARVDVDAPVVPAGTALRAGIAGEVFVGGSLDACGFVAARPTSIELVAGPKNGPMDTYTLQQDPPGWSAWDRRPAMDLMSLPAGSGMATMARAEVGRAPASNAAYGIAGGYSELGALCDVHLYSVLVEPTSDGWQITEVGRRAMLPPAPFDESDPSSSKVCGLDREVVAKAAPCGTRVTKVTGVHAPETGGPLTGRRLLTAAGLAQGMAPWADTEALLVARLGPPTRTEDKHYTWAVRDGEQCVWFDVEKGWPGPIMGSGNVDPAERVGTVTEPYAAVDGAPYFRECMALTGG